MKKFYLIILIKLFTLNNTYAQCKIKYENYDLIFEENFENINNINELKDFWMFKHDDPGWGWGPGDSEYYDENQVQILPNGILRLKAERLSSPVPIWSEWLNDYRLCNYKSGMIQLKRELTNYPFDGCENWGGFKYGMFEVRMKIPKGDVFPAFWLIGPTQLNIFEGKFNSRYFGVGYTNEWEDIDPITNRLPGQGHWYNKATLEDLADTFHTYTGVWTPDNITYFFNGREIATFKNDTVSNLNPWCNANSIIVSLQMPEWSNETYSQLDIDYIKVYKPKNNDYNLEYKSNKEYVPIKFSDIINSDIPNISHNGNSILVNPKNNNELFVRGTDNYLYNIYKSDTEWKIKKLTFNHNGGSLVKGDIVYLYKHDKVLYVGEDNRINLFGRSSSINTGFYHWYLRENWWEGDYDKVYSANGNLQTDTNGNIYFKGLDEKIHLYKFENDLWVHSILNHPNQEEAKVGGDIVIASNTGNIIYRGKDNRLQYFKKTNNTYVHGWIDSNPEINSWMVNQKEKSITYSSSLNSVFYIGQDGRLNQFKYNLNNNTWTHYYIPQPSGFPNPTIDSAKLALNSISWDENKQRIYYLGANGRIQSYYNNNNIIWLHSYIDDYWDTNQYTSFRNFKSSSLSSGYQSNNHCLYYVNKNSQLYYFRNSNCEILNPEYDEWTILSKNISTENNIELNKIEFDLYPNPSQDIIKINNNNNNSIITFDLKIYTIEGREVLAKNKINSNSEINVSNLKNGFYICSIKYNQKITNLKFIKL